MTFVAALFVTGQPDKIPSAGNNVTATLDEAMEHSVNDCIVLGNDDAYALNLSLVTNPFHPPSIDIPDQKLSKRTLRFQAMQMV